MTRMTNKTRVAVFYGGRSTEHSVSCVSASAVMAHLDRDRYEVIPVGITKDGVFTVGEQGLKLSMASCRKLRCATSLHYR